MARPNWWNENRNRAYPFVAGTVRRPADGPLTLRNLADDVVADAGFVVGVAGQFDAAEHAVWLDEIARDGDTFTLTFRSDAPGLDGVPLVFTRQAGYARYALEFADAGPPALGSASSTSAATCAGPAWWGFLVTGEAGALELLLPADGAVPRGAGGAVAEPATVQNLTGTYVAAVHLANQDRTRATAPAGCDPYQWDFATGGVITNAVCLGGTVRFKAGYNAVITQSDTTNTITVGAAVGAGAGEPCAEVPLWPGDGPPAGGGVLLTGGPGCGETLRSINGVGGPAFTVTAGVGVSVTADPDGHRLVVDVDMSGLALCYVSASSVSAAPVSLSTSASGG